MLPSRYVEDKEPDLVLDAARNEVINNFIPHIPDFKQFQLYAVKKDSALGRYCANSKTMPVICIARDVCQNAAKKYNISLYNVYLTTILHELAHAIQDCRNQHFCEIQAESVADDYCNGKISKWITENNKRISITIKS